MGRQQIWMHFTGDIVGGGGSVQPGQIRKCTERLMAPTRLSIDDIDHKIKGVDEELLRGVRELAPLLWSHFEAVRNLGGSAEAVDEHGGVLMTPGSSLTSLALEGLSLALRVPSTESDVGALLSHVVRTLVSRRAPSPPPANPPYICYSRTTDGLNVGRRARR